MLHYHPSGLLQIKSMTRGEKLKQLLQNRGIQQKKLAEKIGVTEGMVTHVIKNRHNFHVDIWQMVAQLLGVTVDYFTSDADLPAIMNDIVPKGAKKNAKTGKDLLKKAFADIDRNTEWKNMTVVEQQQLVIQMLMAENKRLRDEISGDKDGE